MKCFLLSLVMTAVAGAPVLAAHGRPHAGTHGVRSAGRARPAHLARPVLRPGHAAPRPAPVVRPAVHPAHVVRPVARPAQHVRPATRPVHAGGAAGRAPAWGRAPRALRLTAPPAGWHGRGPGGAFIARNYPHWSRNWWSPKWGLWFRFDPTTNAYYYYEPAVGCYVEVVVVTTYRRPLATPLSEPPTGPDDVPPDPIEP